MTVPGSNKSSNQTKFRVLALVVSLLLHVLGYSTWKIGQKEGWWRELTAPRWLQAIVKPLIPPAPQKPPDDSPSQTSLAFVEIDPATATTTPPPKPMFIAAQNTVAGNPDPKIDSQMPQIDGNQDRYLKIAPNGLRQPQQPVPEPPPVAPSQPTPPAKENTPPTAVRPGNTVEEPPNDKTQPGKAQITEQKKPEAPPKQPRPRTIAEARSRLGTPGQRSRNEGGVNNITTDVSVDAKGTPVGDYMDKFVEAVRSCWYDLLQNESPDVTGRVVLHFRLMTDGSIKNMLVVKSEVTQTLEMACERAVTKPAPFEKWTSAMRAEVADDHYDITFTFYYEP